MAILKINLDLLDSDPLDVALFNEVTAAIKKHGDNKMALIAKKRTVREDLGFTPAEPATTPVAEVIAPAPEKPKPARTPKKEAAPEPEAEVATTPAEEPEAVDYDNIRAQVKQVGIKFIKAGQKAMFTNSLQQFGFEKTRDITDELAEDVLRYVSETWETLQEGAE